MNNVQLIGRLTADPELRQTQSGVSVCRFTVAVNRKFKNKQTGEFEADFFPCVAWRQTAEIVSRYWNKGKMIAITGALRTGSYQDKNHPDVTHYTTDIMVDNVEFCGDKADNTNIVQKAQKAGIPVQQEYADLSDFEEILSDGVVPF